MLLLFSYVIIFPIIYTYCFFILSLLKHLYISFKFKIIDYYKSFEYFTNWYIGFTTTLLILSKLPWKYISPIATILSLGVLPFIPKILQRMSRDILKDKYTNNTTINRLKQNMTIKKNKRK